MWRYDEILKGMYASTSGLPIGLLREKSATPPPSSVREIRERLTIIEELLQDVLSRFENRDVHGLVEQLAKAMKEQRKHIERLESQISDLKRSFSKLSSQISVLEAHIRTADYHDSYASLVEKLEERLRRIEKAIVDLSQGISYSSFKPVELVQEEGPGDAVGVGGVNPFLALLPRKNLRKPRGKGSKK